MGFLRKAAIVSTGGMARGAINPNSKKARTAKANEKMLKLQRSAAKREAAAQRQAASATAAAQRQAAASSAQRTTRISAAPTTVASVDAPSQPAVAGLVRAAMSVADELEKLAALRDSNVLTAEEFDTQKAKILNSAPRQP